MVNIEVLTAISMLSTVFWIVRPCSSGEPAVLGNIAPPSSGSKWAAS
jgi:hypothetical protein